MINHRFHLVAVVSVFLAVAVGFGVAFTAAGGGSAAKAAAERADTDRMQDRLDRLETESDGAADFAEGVAAPSLAALLDGQRVLVIGAGGASRKQLDAVTDTLAQSRAEAAGTLRFSAEYTDPGNSTALVDLAAKLTPKGVKPPNDNDGVETVSALLAMSILDKSEVSARDRDRLVRALTGLDMVTETTELSDEAATAVVIVSGAADSEQAAGVATLADRFGREGATVLAGAKPDGVVAAVREDPARSKRISTVDNVDSPQGRVTAVLALPSTIEGEIGHYGTGSSATAAVPETS